MDDARDGAVRVFRQRVFGQTVIIELPSVRDALKPDWITGISDQAKIVRVDPDVKKVVQFVGKLVVETESLDEVFSAIDALTQYFLPEFHANFGYPYCETYFP